jgi:hypothetical protein
VVRITRDPDAIHLRAARISTPEGNGNRKVVGRNVPLAVRLTSEARREIREIEWRDDAEVGGWAFGYVDNVEVVVCALRGSNWSDGMVGDRTSMVMARHTFATWAIEDGRMSLIHLATIMGTSVRQLEDTYFRWLSHTDEQVRTFLDEYDPAASA